MRGRGRKDQKNADELHSIMTNAYQDRWATALITKEQSALWKIGGGRKWGQSGVREEKGTATQPMEAKPSLVRSKLLVRVRRQQAKNSQEGKCQT